MTDKNRINSNTVRGGTGGRSSADPDDYGSARVKGTSGQINVGRADRVVEDAVIVEAKSAAVLAPIHHKQLVTYLRLLHHRLGLTLSSGAPLMKDGIHRVANSP